MDRLKTLLARYRQTAFLVFLGLVLIVYIALGILYLQQAPQRRQMEEQIARLSAILRNPLPDSNILQAELNDIDLALTPLSDNTTIAMLLDIAEKSGIDTSEANGKFQVPIAAHGSSDAYQLQSFKGIQLQGDREAVIAFLRLLDSDDMLTPPGSAAPRAIVRVVTRVVVQDIGFTLSPESEEGKRRAEFRSIQQAVKALMADNSIIRLPNPVSASKGRAANRMGDDPSTLGVFDGFPDNTTTAAVKGYTGNATPKNGYLLWEHDKVNPDKITFTTADYTQTLRTVYYYTAEEDGTVRQWNGPNVFSAREFFDSGPTTTETRANLDIDFYFKGK